MLILVGVVVSTTINSNLINKVKTAKGMHETKQQEEANLAGVTVGEDQYDSLQDYVDGKKSGSVQVELADGTKVTLTKENFGAYLGKIVTNYTGQTSVNGYTVSDTYRLYYVDFDNKYGDGAGTIYLKAECTSNCYVLPNTDTSSADAENIKIKNLNPALYGITPSNPSGSSDVISPSTTNDNMKAVTWLTNTTNWAGLADTTHTEISGKINYIVGSPSVEMMMDSYNTHYADELTGTTTPDFNDITPGERRKLFYIYHSNGIGYQVGPNADSDVEYDNYTSENSVYTDTIDSMYYPGEGKWYWLASPSAGAPDSVMGVYWPCGGYVRYSYSSNDFAFCPLVSLDSSVQLKLEN